jgi:hypothetical protein
MELVNGFNRSSNLIYMGKEVLTVHTFCYTSLSWPQAKSGGFSAVNVSTT